jgi:hypothetical protein
MSCSEYETLVRQFRCQRELISSFDSVDMNDHGLSAGRASELSAEAQAMVADLENSIHWHKKTCEACKE